MFAIDLVVSLAIFILILLSSAYMLARMRADMQTANEKNALAASSIFAFDSLAYSPGAPSDWTPATVSSVGLSFDSTNAFYGQRIDGAKLLRLAKLNYSAARQGLGLGAYDFQLIFTEAWNASGPSSALLANASHSGVVLEPVAYYASDDRDAFALLNGAGVQWDYYWAGSGAEPSHGDAAHFYSAAQYGGKAGLFNAMLANATAASGGVYRTIVVEQPGFATADYAGVNQTALRNFFKARGLLIYEGSVSAADAPQTPLLLTSLNESLAYVPSSQTGTVVQTGFFLDNVSAGDNASFTQSNWGVYSDEAAGNSALTVFVRNATNASLALAASWQCENGRVYYVADFDSFFGSSSAPGASVFNFVGPALKFGFPPAADATDSFVLTRPVIIQRDWGSLAAVKLVVWMVQ